MTQPFPTYRDVAGLRIPIQLVPRIVAAFRGTYPQITDGLTDDAATRAVLRNFVTSTLSVYESQRAAQTVQEDIETRRASIEVVANAAFEKAKTDLGAITDAPVVGVDTVIPVIEPPVDSEGTVGDEPPV